MTIENRLKELGLELPDAPKKGGVYASVKEIADRTYCISGCGCMIQGNEKTGKVGNELTLEEGKEAAKRAVLNFLAVAATNLGGLDNIESIAKLLVFVSSSTDFYRQPEVADGATEVLVQVFGEKVGAPGRSAIGVAVLPGNIPVEIEGIVKIK